MNGGVNLHETVRSTWAKLAKGATEHPLVEVPTVAHLAAMVQALGADAGVARFKEVLSIREDVLAQAETDPMRFGYQVESWRRADAQWSEVIRELLILGGNRSAKTEYAARRLVSAMRDIKNARVWAFHETESSSRAQQQSRVWRYVPPEWRNLRADQVVKIRYKQASGFSDNTFVFPNRSQCWFKFYKGEMGALEGEELDFVWCDELVPLGLIESMRYRLATRDGEMLVTFTPIHGYTPTVKSYLDGAETVARADAQHLPLPGGGYESVPLVQQCKRPGSRVVYFHTEDNIFGNPAQVVARTDMNDREKVKIRLYGVVTRAKDNQFPKFNQDVHVAKAAVFWEALRGLKLTWYQVVDPCSGRNFFMQWAAVDPMGQIYVAREWPQEDDYIEGVGYPGPWAVIDPDGKLHDGKRGDAQRPWGLGLTRIAGEMARVEGEVGDRLEMEEDGVAVSGVPIDPFERIIDSRFAASPTITKSGSSTLLSDLQDEGLDFIPAPGEAMNEGIVKINDALDYDAKRPIDSLNRPRLIVNAECRATLFALSNWTNLDGKHGACKDPVDTLRYLLLRNPEFVGSGLLDSTGPDFQM